MMKNVIFIIFLSIKLMSAHGQNYVRLGDLSGFNITQPELEELNIKATELRNNLPSEYRDSFKVFSYSFYALNEYYQEGFNEVFESIMNEVESEYYLILGRQMPDSKGKARIFFSLKLPVSENTTCLERENYIINKLDENINKNITRMEDLHGAEIKAMQQLYVFLNCEICDNEIDDDGDDFIDCEDIDCMYSEFFNFKKNIKNERNTNCIVPNQSQIECILENYEFLKQLKIDDFETSLLYCDEVNDLLNAPIEEPDPIDDNGIIITNIYVPNKALIPGKLIANTTYRNEHNPPRKIAPDLSYGHDGDENVISPKNKNILNWPLNDLEDKMSELLHFACNSNYDPIATKMFNRFKSKNGQTYDDEDISDLIKGTIEVQNKIKLFGKQFENRLKQVNGNHNLLSLFQLEDEDRFILSAGNGYLFMGPTILINDVSQVNYYLQGFNIDVNGNWNATFYVEAIDHFGLDNEDPNHTFRFKGIKVAIYQHLHIGFAAWWVLQHKKSYRPFVTKIRIGVELNGNINP